MSLEGRDTKDDRNEGAEVLSSSIQIPYAGRGMTLRNVDSEPAANVPESGIRNKLNLNADDDCPEGAEALKEANFCKRRLRRT